MSIKQRRTAQAWSQEDLARHSGLSVRTIQRIEAGQKAGLESLKSLAAVFECTVSELMEEHNMNNETGVSKTPLINEVEREAISFAQTIISGPKSEQPDALTATERKAVEFAKSLINKFKT